MYTDWYKLKTEWKTTKGELTLVNKYIRREKQKPSPEKHYSNNCCQQDLLRDTQIGCGGVWKNLQDIY